MFQRHEGSIQGDFRENKKHEGSKRGREMESKGYAI